MTIRKYFSGPREYEAYTPYVLAVDGKIDDVFTNKKSAERARDRLPAYVHGEVMTRKQFAAEHRA